MNVGRGGPPLSCETSAVSCPVRKRSAAANSSKRTPSSARGAALRERALEAEPRDRVRSLERDDHLVGADGARRELGAVEHEMRELAQQQRVLRAQRLALAAVGDDDRPAARAADRAHLARGREARRRRGRAGRRARRRRSARSASSAAARAAGRGPSRWRSSCVMPGAGAAAQQARQRDRCRRASRLIGPGSPAACRSRRRSRGRSAARRRAQRVAVGRRPRARSMSVPSSAVTEPL